MPSTSIADPPSSTHLPAPHRICALVLESSPERRGFSRHGRQQYVGHDAVGALHRLLRVQATQSLDFQAFLDLLQRCGEERRLLELNDEVGDWRSGRSVQVGGGCVGSKQPTVAVEQDGVPVVDVSSIVRHATPPPFPYNNNATTHAGGCVSPALPLRPSTPPPAAGTHPLLVQAQDDWVPLDVVKELVQTLFCSSVKLLAAAGLDQLNWAGL